jgi:conjugative relaxase-like TrwC/TraI family protein
MLGVHRLTSRGADYYLEDLAGELPLPAGWAPGRASWVGRAGVGLGLHGAVDPASLRAVLEGRHPTAEWRLRSDRATVRGFDLTFSVPKTVSVVFALGGEDVARQVLAAHLDGVRGALTYLEAHALTAQRGSGEERQIVPTTGLVGASFTHGVSRTLDPHLHTHVVTANLVHGPDRRWSAFDHRGLAAHRGALSAIYESHLRAELSTRLGLRWVGGPRLSADVDGISPFVVGEFSSRSADIRRHMSERGVRSRRGARIAWAATRPAKRGGLDFAELVTDWERRAGSVGSGPGEVAAVLGRGAGRAERQFFDEHRFGASLSLTPDGAARRRDVAAAFGTAALGGAAAASIERLTELWTPTASTRAQIGVAEDIHPPRRMVPGPHVLAALGPRPVHEDDHVVWRTAADAIEGYRHRWNVVRGTDALGTQSLTPGISSLSTERLIDHLETVRHIEVARQRLGWRPERGHEMALGR